MHGYPDSLGMSSSSRQHVLYDAPTSSRMQTTYCATDLPQWNAHRNPEHQTRRHLEHAAEARMKILRRRLEQQEGQIQRPPFIVSPSKWKAEQEREGRKHSQSPPPSRGRSTSPYSARPGGNYSIEIELTRARPRSASPMRGGKNNLLVNDFVQWKPAGVYRNLEQRWEMDHLSVSERLDKISSLCQGFKQQYSVDERQENIPINNTRQIQSRSPATVAHEGPLSLTVATRAHPRPSYLTANEEFEDRSSFRFTPQSRPPPPPATETLVPRPRAHMYSPPAVSLPISSLRGSPFQPSHTRQPSSSPHHLFSPSKTKSPTKTATKGKPASLAFGHRVIPAAHMIDEERRTLQRISAFLKESKPHSHMGRASTFPSMQAEIDSFTSATNRTGAHNDLDASWPEIFQTPGDKRTHSPLYTLPDMLPEYNSPLNLVSKSSTTKFELRTKSPRKPDHTATVSPALEGLSHRERLQAGIRELQAEMSRLRQDLSPIRGALSSTLPEDLASTIPGLGWAVRVPPNRMSPEKMWG